MEEKQTSIAKLASSTAGWVAATTTPARSAAVDTAELERAQTVMDMFDLAGAPVKPVVARLVSRRDSSTTSGSDAIEICEGDDVVKVGRSKTLPAAQRIDNMRLSSLHCELHLAPLTLEVFLVDTSTNGTYLNGKRVERGKRMILQPGDVIALLNSNTTVSSSKGGEAPGSEDATGATSEVEYLFQRLKSSVKQEALTEELTCSICRSIFYRAVSAVPCLHVFCGHCLSACLELNTQCPECRLPIDEVRPTHKINNLVEQLLKARPELAPSKEEMADYDKSNTIPPTGKRLAAAGKKRPRDDDEWNSDEEDDEDDEDIDGGGGAGGAVAGGWGLAAAPHVFHHFAPGFGPAPPPKFCPQCTAPSPADGFICPPDQAHLKCICCKSPFPDRPLCGIPQKCLLCNMAACDLYLPGGCVSAEGRGFLRAIKDHAMAAGAPLPLRLFGGNTIEQGVLSSYLTSAGVSGAEAWVECQQQFASGAWVPDVTSMHGPVVPETVICKPCCSRVFAGLLYHYRRAIPREALPAAVTARPNCWYGRECRTQFHKVAHAQNFNHACPQEKRKE